MERSGERHTETSRRTSPIEGPSDGSGSSRWRAPLHLLHLQLSGGELKSCSSVAGHQDSRRQPVGY